MNLERFSIPELLFHPSDIGIHEMGVAEAVIHTISQTPPGSFTMCPHLMSDNVGPYTGNLLYVYKETHLKHFSFCCLTFAIYSLIL